MLSQEINKRYYPESYKPGNTPEEFKKLILGCAQGDVTYNSFVIFEDNDPLAWYDFSSSDGELYFGFDILSDHISGYVLRTILEKINGYMIENNFREIICGSFRDSINNSLKEINAPVSEEMMRSKLDRVDMDVSFYEKIVKESELYNFNLLHCNQVPEVHLDKFVDCINVCFADMGAINPHRIEHIPLTAEDWKKDKLAQRNNGTTLEIYMLLDSKNEIAGICWVCVDSYRKEIIRHNGGLTAVMPKYRGLGISRFLKAHQYLRLLKENKDFRSILTDTMPWNKYMYKINEDFGFKPYKKGYCFKLTIEFIKNYLNL